MTSNVRNIDAFVRDELRLYAIYDNERSLPSCVDGLKISQRKILHTVFETLKDGEEVKTSVLGNNTSGFTHYQHSEDSIVNTVIGMAQDFPGANNYPLLEKEGQFGTAINNKSSSPRYIFIRRGKNLAKMFDAEDKDVIEYLSFDGDDIEPAFFLPKLPLLAINGSVGIGNGYGCKILPRNVQDVANAVLAMLNGDDFIAPLPWFNGFKGAIVNAADNHQSVIVTGTFKRVDSTTTIITDLPPHSTFQYESYKNRVLIPLLTDKTSGLNEFLGESKEGEWKIILKHSREFGKKTDQQMIQTLKMSLRMSETIACWGFDGKLKTFDSIVSLLKYWIDNRLVYLDKRKQNMLSKMEAQKSWLENLSALIDFWLSHTDLVKQKKQDIVNSLKAVTDNVEHINKFLGQDILSLTVERQDKIKKELETIRTKYNALLNTSEKQLMIQDISSVLN